MPHETIRYMRRGKSGRWPSPHFADRFAQPTSVFTDRKVLAKFDAGNRVQVALIVRHAGLSSANIRLVRKM